MALSRPAYESSSRSKVQKVCKELKENLIGFYRNHHSKIQVSPLVEGNDVDLVEFYVEPPMTAIDLQRKLGNPRKTPAKFSKELFFRDDQNAFKNIYVTAGPGLGKTSFSQRICMAWCQAHDPDTSLDDKFEPDEVLALQGFDILFMIPLRDAHKSRCDLDGLIRAYLQRHLPRGQYLNMLDTIFNERSCLILLDGLDEWSHPKSCSTGHNAREVPHRKFRKNWTILTTTRPWKFDEIRLASHQIDRHVEINELDEDSSHRLVVNAIKLLNLTNILKTIDIQYLHSLNKLELCVVARQPDVEQLLRQSMATLQYLCLRYTIYKHGMYTSEMTMLSKECKDIILSMPLLKGLWLNSFIVTHNQLENLTTFLTSRVTMTQISMFNITCTDHKESCPGVQLHLSGHENLQAIALVNVPISQLQVNTQHLEECVIGRLPSSVITSCLTSLPAAHNLHTFFCRSLNATDLFTLSTTIPALLPLKDLLISHTDLCDRKLDLSTDMTRLELIQLFNVSMSSSALRALADTICSLSQSVTVRLLDCTVTPDVEYVTVKEDIKKSDTFTVACGRQIFIFQTVM